ncbi:hypothetical protein L7F22_023845 [Adiantum nelumboides]|nr:hypothetical protein [Adiantum nelumboides]
MKQFLASDAKDKILTKWISLKLTPYESIHKYVDRFWDLHLKAIVYKKIDFEEQKQQFCARLLEDMNEYVNSQRPKSISAVIHHTMVATRINFQQGAKRNIKPMEAKDKQEYKGKNISQNSFRGNSNNNNAKEKGVFKVLQWIELEKGLEFKLLQMVVGSWEMKVVLEEKGLLEKEEQRQKFQPLPKISRFVHPKDVEVPLKAFCMTKEDFHKEYGLSLEGKDVRKLTEEDVPMFDWLKVFTCLLMKEKKVPIETARLDHYKGSETVVCVPTEVRQLEQPTGSCETQLVVQGLCPSLDFSVARQESSDTETMTCVDDRHDDALRSFMDMPLPMSARLSHGTSRVDVISTETDACEPCMAMLIDTESVDEPDFREPETDVLFYDVSDMFEDDSVFQTSMYAHGESAMIADSASNLDVLSRELLSIEVMSTGLAHEGIVHGGEHEVNTLLHVWLDATSGSVARTILGTGASLVEHESSTLLQLRR